MTNMSALASRLLAAEATLQERSSALMAQAELLELQAASYVEAMDQIWIMLATILVVFMHAGFSLLEAGSVRQKNAMNILAKNLLVVAIGFLCWWLFGYAFALGAADDPSRWVGSKGFAMDGILQDQTQFKFWLFQGAFCATAATIVSGAMAERVQIKGFVTFTIIVTSFIYPCVVYWAWSGSGFLNYTDDAGNSVSHFGPPLIDFAGSGVVHMIGGIAALCGAAIVGPRKDRFSPSAEDEFSAHNIPFCVLGTLVLWVGWYGFNPGSTGSMHDKDTAVVAGLVSVNTTLSPCVAGLIVFTLRANVIQPKRLDVGGFCNGILAGLVAITSGCAVVRPWESMCIGFVAGLLYQGASMLVAKYQVDDVVDAFAVHGMNGLWGVLASGLFGDPKDGLGGNGTLYGGNQLNTQLMAVLIFVLWAALPSVLIFAILKYAGLLRLGDDFQDTGADCVEHSPAHAYALKK